MNNNKCKFVLNTKFEDLHCISFFPQGLKLGVVRFRFDGNPINETDTPSGVSQMIKFLVFLCLKNNKVII